MVTAKDKFEPKLAQHIFRDPKIPVVANVDAEYVRDGNGARENLVLQLCAPVRWQQSMERLISEGYQRFVEVGPKKVLRGLMRQIDRNVEVYNVEDPESLETVLEQLNS
jgi:[acyl-carrier-protein] S-malonyltransferase